MLHFYPFFSIHFVRPLRFLLKFSPSGIICSLFSDSSCWGNLFSHMILLCRGFDIFHSSLCTFRWFLLLLPAIVKVGHEVPQPPISFIFTSQNFYQIGVRNCFCCATLQKFDPIWGALFDCIVNLSLIQLESLILLRKLHDIKLTNQVPYHRFLTEAGIICICWSLVFVYYVPLPCQLDSSSILSTYQSASLKLW